MVDWRSIDDSIATEMLTEIYRRLGDEELLIRYATALERRYGKPEGTISNLIFYEDLSEKEILKRLKVDTVTYL